MNQNNAVKCADNKIIVIKGIILSVNKITETNLLKHVLKLRITDSQGNNGIDNCEIIQAHGNISPVLAKEKMPLCLTGEYLDKSDSGNVLRIIKASIDISSKDSPGLFYYLSSGAIADINKHSAGQIIQHFGNEVLQILDESPEKIKGVPGINELTKQRIIDLWTSHREKADSVIETMSIGLSASTARRVVERFGTSAADKLYDNPYLLSDVQGYGYVRADKYAKVCGLSENSDERIQAAMWYCLNAAAKEGHSYLPFRELVKRVAKITNADSKQISKISPPGEVVVASNRNTYIRHLFEAERYVSQQIRKMSFEKPSWTITKSQINKIVSSDTIISPEQKQAVIDILTGPRLSAILGPPGTGKTTLIKTLLSIMQAVGLSCLLAAPTGKAANRITEQTSHTAMTIHRLLGINRSGSVSNVRLQKADCIVIDEASFIDIILMRQLLKSLSSGTALILVGDSNQLPSVGPGGVLKEIRDKGLCNVVALNYVYRQGERSQIVRLAHAIHKGMVSWDIFGNQECVFVPEEDALRIKEKVIDIVAGNPHYKPNQIQVLTPMKRGVIGTSQLNLDLRTRIRSYNLKLIKNMGVNIRTSTAGSKSGYYDVGDKVIQKTNNYKKSVSNGEIGYVLSCDETGRLIVAFDGGRKIAYEGHEIYQLDYAYALTVHKAQGSEYQCVVVPVHTTHFIMLFRSLLYTAVTRARERVYLVGSMKAALIAARNNRNDIRYANLSA